MLKKIALGLVALFAVIQLVPYGWDHENPPVVKEPAWDSPETKALVQRSCYDCHSHETKWPWYSNVAPARWFVYHHVDEGRHELNFSRWDKKQKHAKDAAEEVEEGEMPLAPYLITHGEAKLTDAEKEALIKGLKATVAASPPGA